MQLLPVLDGFKSPCQVLPSRTEIFIGYGGVAKKNCRRRYSFRESWLLMKLGLPACGRAELYAASRH